MSSSLPFNEDFDDLLSALVSAGAEFVVVGAYALAAHGVLRATADIDIFVRPSQTNASKVYRALLSFGAPVQAHGVREADFAGPNTVYQLGLPPRRIDLLTSISGVTFDEAIAKPISAHLGQQTVRFIGREALIRNKRATGRPKDTVDADTLEALPNAG